MSRIGKKPIEIPKGVKVELQGQCVTVQGPLGQLRLDCHPRIRVRVDESEGNVIVENERPKDRQNRQLHGTMRALIANMVAGVSKGYERKLEIYGTGYNVKEQGGKLLLQVGYANTVERVIPEGVKVTIEAATTRGNDVPAKFTLSSIDKRLLGQFAAEVRKSRPPEPYKGKGIRYTDEHVRRKAGKAFASGGA
ncbi:MAG TPA: 50S ribosomal protein L6 [Sedimentisphaerales bacterium]|jgi:large subunit ribosomal protein L6|nr:50S ribosomal protein L6 [Sedimentisphaerales bacterium]